MIAKMSAGQRAHAYNYYSVPYVEWWMGTRRRQSEQRRDKYQLVDC